MLPVGSDSSHVIMSWTDRGSQFQPKTSRTKRADKDKNGTAKQKMISCFGFPAQGVIAICRPMSMKYLLSCKDFILSWTTCMLKPRSSKEFLASRVRPNMGFGLPDGKANDSCGINFVTNELPLQLHFFQELANVHTEMQVCLNFQTRVLSLAPIIAHQDK